MRQQRPSCRFCPHTCAFWGGWRGVSGRAVSHPPGLVGLAVVWCGLVWLACCAVPCRYHPVRAMEHKATVGPINWACRRSGKLDVDVHVVLVLVLVHAEVERPWKEGKKGSGSHQPSYLVWHLHLHQLVRRDRSLTSILRCVSEDSSGCDLESPSLRWAPVGWHIMALESGSRTRKCRSPASQAGRS